MKFGIRKPSLKRKIKAKTTGKMKRSLNKAIKPGYGKKGTGLLKDPKKSLYNKAYNKTSYSLFDIFLGSTSSNAKSKNNDNYTETISSEVFSDWKPEYMPTNEEQKYLHLYFSSGAAMKEFRKTNPTDNQINIYISNITKNFEGLKGVLKYWKRVNYEIPPNIPIRNESIDILMRCNKISEAKNLYTELKQLGIYEECPEIEDNVINLIENYPENINAVIEYISNNMGVEQTKARKKLNEKIDSTTLTWILNRTYFIRKEKIEGKNFLYLNEKYAYN